MIQVVEKWGYLTGGNQDLVSLALSNFTTMSPTLLELSSLMLPCCWQDYVFSHARPQLLYWDNPEMGVHPSFC